MLLLFLKCIYHCHGNKYLPLVFLFHLPSPFQRLTQPFSPPCLYCQSILPLCNHSWIYSSVYYDSLKFQQTSSLPKSICVPPWAGWFPQLPWRKYPMTWLPAAKPRSSGRAPFTVSLLRPPLIHFLLSSAGQGRSFEDAFPRLHHKAGWRRCALRASQTLLHPFFASSCSLIFISLAPAFIAINTDSNISCFFFKYSYSLSAFSLVSLQHQYNWNNSVMDKHRI